MGADPEQFVGKIPEFYDRNMGPVIFAGYAIDMASRVAALKPKRVLETACGTGIVSLELRRALIGDVEIVATDLNPPMLDIARAKLKAHEQIQFQAADAQDLGFEDASFDVVVCQFGVMFYPDKDRSYREAFRVLAPGGRYLFSVWDGHRYNAFSRIVHQALARVFPMDPPQFMAIPFSYPFEPIKDSLVAAGFDDIGASVVRIARELPNARSFAEGMVYGSPVIDQVKARGGVDPDALVDIIAADFTREFGADPGRMSLQALVFSATRPS